MAPTRRRRAISGGAPTAPPPALASPLPCRADSCSTAPAPDRRCLISLPALRSRRHQRPPRHVAPSAATTPTPPCLESPLPTPSPPRQPPRPRRGSTRPRDEQQPRSPRCGRTRLPGRPPARPPAPPSCSCQQAGHATRFYAPPAKAAKQGSSG